jgi:hypothetical protein
MVNKLFTIKMVKPSNINEKLSSYCVADFHHECSRSLAPDRAAICQADGRVVLAAVANEALADKMAYEVDAMLEPAYEEASEEAYEEDHDEADMGARDLVEDVVEKQAEIEAEERVKNISDDGAEDASIEEAEEHAVVAGIETVGTSVAGGSFLLASSSFFLSS